jgi:hypothetical protein
MLNENASPGIGMGFFMTRRASIACVSLFGLAVICSAGPLQAAGNGGQGAETAAKLLARAWMINSHCKVLSSDEADTLSGLVARAEITLAEKKGVQAARNAITAGRSEAKQLPCDAASAAEAKDTLAAAKSAVAMMPETAAPAAADAVAAASAVAQAPVIAAQTAAEPAAQADDEAGNDPAAAPPAVEQQSALAAQVVEPQTAPTIKKAKRQISLRKQMSPTGQIRVVAVTKPVTRAKPAVVGIYGKTAEDYYVELRCRTMSQRAVNAFYAQVLSQHRAAVSTSGKAAVRAVLARAQARAAQRSC